jgi:hypothetical protein
VPSFTKTELKTTALPEQREFPVALLEIEAETFTEG